MTATVHAFPESPAEYRTWLLSDRERVAAWLDERLTPEQVVEQYPELASSTKTLANWRQLGRGPRFVRLSRIFYRRVDLLHFMESRVVDPAAVA